MSTRVRPVLFTDAFAGSITFYSLFPGSVKLVLSVNLLSFVECAGPNGELGNFAIL